MEASETNEPEGGARRRGAAAARPDRSHGTAGDRGSSRDALAGVAGRLRRLFRLPVPDAPRLVFVGGTTAPEAYGLDPEVFRAADVCGRGEDIEEAFAGCIGEAVEHLSGLEWGDETFETRGPNPPPGLGTDTAAALTAESAGRGSDEWLPATRLGDGLASALPARLCLHRADGSRPPGSAGLGAGDSLEGACLHALLELIERDAVALWWQAGRPARPVEPDATSTGLEGMLAALRGHAAGRRSWFLDITSDLDVPTIAAISADNDGFGLAFGFAARPTTAEAARAAALELCQMELANRLVSLKLDRDGPGALGPAETRRRGLADIDAASSPVLSPSGPSRPRNAEETRSDMQGRLESVLARLARCGIECLAADLTRPALGVPAVRIVAPLLAGLGTSSERLRRARISYRARARYLHPVDIL